jgi:hypothetical protein
MLFVLKIIQFWTTFLIISIAVEQNLISKPSQHRTKHLVLVDIWTVLRELLVLEEV